MRIYRKVDSRTFFGSYAVTVRDEQTFFTVHRPNTVWRNAALAVQIPFHLRLDSGFAYDVVTRIPEWRKILICNTGDLTYVTYDMAGIKSFRGIRSRIFLA